MAEAFAGGESLVVCLGDNIFEHAEAEVVSAWAEGPDGALIFVKEVPDPERFGVVVYGEDGAVADVVEKAGVVDTRYDAPPSNDAVVGPLLLPGRRLRDHPRAGAVLARRARDHGRQPRVRGAGRLRSARVSGWWRDAGTHEALGRIGNLIDETGVEQAR